MTPTVWATLAIAAVTILSAIGSVLLLAFRVGKLTGATEARINAADADRTRIWEAIGALVAKLDRHLESRHVR